MPAFTTVAAVRLRAGLDEAVAAEPLVQACIDDAHAQIDVRLAPGLVVDPVPALLDAGAALLAVAGVLRTLAARAAAERRQVRVGGQSVERGRQTGELAALADRFQQETWEILVPFLGPAPAGVVVEVTETQAVL